MNFNLTVDIKKKKNTLLSGGRFDKLIGNLGSKNIPAVGAALNSDIL
jgi:histidyl-tRNA synthetase